MYKRTMTAITLGLTAAMVAIPAEAKTEALLIGTPRSSGALDELRDTLKTGFAIGEVQVATVGNTHDLAERVRGFLAATGKPDDLRVVWVHGGDDACPGFDEEPVRPQARSLVIAPTCMKLLVQAPTTYERLGTEGRNDRNGIDPRSPAIAFVSLTGEKSRKSSDALSKPGGSLIQTLACARPGQAALDFSPSIAAWDVSGTACPTVQQVSLAPLPARPTEKVPSPTPTVPERAPTPEPRVEVAPAPAIALQGDEFHMVFPAKGRVVSAFGNPEGGKPNKGIDLEVPAGTMARSAEAGEVVFVGELPGYGQVVAIKHDNDWATVYARTMRPRVIQGQKVTKGQELAEVDPATNRLHFEVRRKGKPMDPETLMSSG